MTADLMWSDILQNKFPGSGTLPYHTDWATTNGAAEENAIRGNLKTSESKYSEVGRR